MAIAVPYYLRYCAERMSPRWSFSAVHFHWQKLYRKILNYERAKTDVAMAKMVFFCKLDWYSVVFFHNPPVDRLVDSM